MIEWTDEQMLDALTLVEYDGLTASQAARALTYRYKGKFTKGAVLGIVFRVKRDYARVGNRRCGDGTMPREWWRDRVKSAQKPVDMSVAP